MTAPSSHPHADAPSARPTTPGDAARAATATRFPTSRPMSSLLPRGLAVALLLSGAALAQIPAHPDDIVAPPLVFEPPQAADYRHELSNGVTVYLAPTDEIPLIDLEFTFKGGAYLEGPDEVGLGAMLGTMLRRGGTTSLGAEALDERFDFLAADVSARVGDESSSASLNCLTSTFDEAFGLFMDMLRNPGFDAERLRVQKEQLLEAFSQRNDQPMGVTMSYASRLVYGDDHFSAREPTAASIGAIDAAALSGLHARIVHPGNLIVAASGDFEPQELLGKLEQAFADWEPGEPAGDVPAPEHRLQPGLYHARTTQGELPQGTALLIGEGTRRDDPDAVALRVMNDILGGGGFTSRITNRVRSDEGLAYTAVSFLRPQVHFDGWYAGFFQSKNETVALAAKIMVEEMERIRSEPVSAEELERTKNGFIETFPQRFASKSRMLSTFVGDQLTERPADWWSTWRQRVADVTVDDVQRVAREHLHPDELAILVIGDWDAIEGGDLDGRADMSEFHGGAVVHLPMLDPLTREPMDDEASAP